MGRTPVCDNRDAMRQQRARAAHRAGQRFELPGARDRRRADSLRSPGGLEEARRSEHHRRLLKQFGLLLVRRTRPPIPQTEEGSQGIVLDLATGDRDDAPDPGRPVRFQEALPGGSEGVGYG